MREMKRGSSGSEKKGVKAWSLRCYRAWQAQPNPSHPNSTQPNPGQARPKNLWANPKGALLFLLPVSFPSIRYTQGKQEGIRIGLDRHLVCWEISLGRSERLPSPLPAPAHQMWGEGHIASSLCSVARVHSPSAFPHTGRHTYCRSTRIFVWKHTHALINKLCMRLYKHAYNTYVYLQAQRNSTTYRIYLHLCSSPPSPLLLSTILHRSEATSSFCWSVRLRLGSCSWQALLSERLNSRYGTKACWSSSQYSRLHGTWKERHSKQLTHVTPKCVLYLGFNASSLSILGTAKWQLIHSTYCPSTQIQAHIVVSN